ncbi:MAG: anthranilate phosphoribosyltransferase, partial [Brevundimonas sp.]
WKDGTVRRFQITPEEAGLPRATLADLRGGDAEENATALRALLAGAPGPYRDVVLLNAAAALVVAGRAADLKDGVAIAARAIDDGTAARSLEALARITSAPAEVPEA